MLLKAFLILSITSLTAVSCGESKDKESTDINETPLGALNPLERENNTFDASIGDAIRVAKDYNENEEDDQCDQFTTDAKTGLVVYKECEDSAEEK